mgnify:CR=1 FL=1
MRGELDLTDSISAWAAFGGRQGEEDNSLANPRADAAGAIRGYRFDNIREDTVWSGDIGVRADLTTGPIEHRLVASASQIQSKSKNAWAASSFAGYAMGTLTDPLLSPAPAMKVLRMSPNAASIAWSAALGWDLNRVGHAC